VNKLLLVRDKQRLWSEAAILVRTVCWSVLGKQLIVGAAGCHLVQFTPEGEAKGTTNPPPQELGLSDGQINDIRWLENHVLLVGYGPQQPSPMTDAPICALIRSKEATTWIRLDDPAFPSAEFESRAVRRLAVSLKDW
jgi:hypothetical protein